MLTLLAIAGFMGLLIGSFIFGVWVTYERIRQGFEEVEGKDTFKVFLRKYRIVD